MATPRIDSHTHVVSTDPERHPRHDMALPNGAWWDQRDCSVESLMAHADQSSVDRIVLIQAAGAYRTDNRYLLDSVATDPSRFCAVVILDPTDLGSPDALQEMAEAGNVVGIRLFHIPRPNASWLSDGQSDALVDTAAELGLAVTVTIQHWDWPDVAHQLERRRDVEFIVDHCGFPDFSGGAPFRQAEPLWTMADHPNLNLKFTPSCALVTGEDPEDTDPAAMLEHVVARFGADRVMWGSDWPQHRERHPESDPIEGRLYTYAEQVEVIAGWTTGLGEADRAAVLGGNAARHFLRAAER